MKLFVAGLSYRTASVTVREQLAVALPQLAERARRLQVAAELDEIVLLSTCNRVEIYGVTHDRARSSESLLAAVGWDRNDMGHHTYIKENAAAVRHLFRVASGLDSMILGETEISGQVKAAYETARSARLTGRILNQVFQKAIHTAKEVRNKTNIGRGATSVGSVLVQLAEAIFGHDLQQQQVMIIGAGQMGETCIRHLAKKGARSILVCNRYFDRAVVLAREFGGEAVRFDNCVQTMAGVDIVVAAASCPTVLLPRADVESLMQTRKNRPLFLIDIAVPRNIDAAVHSLNGVYLYNIDDLRALADENVQSRQKDVARCEWIVDARASMLEAKLGLEIEETPLLLRTCLPCASN
jgi:glutamyl-tRNA reductase